MLADRGCQSTIPAAAIVVIDPLAFFIKTMSTSAQPELASGGETDHGIVLEGRRKMLVEDALSLFQCKANLELFKRGWREDAVFADPIALATGFKQYAAQWFGMPAAFPASETLAWKVVKSEPGLIEFELRQKYTVALIKTTKVMSSLVHIELDSDEFVTRFEDRWDAKPLSTGGIATMLRGLNAKTMPFLISVPKA
ncbi:hypothetical protein RQP46_010846 [Phenoliferia psychrophenolica]